MMTLKAPSRRQLRKADKMWAALRVQITEALEDVNQTITPDGKRLRAGNLSRYTFFGGGGRTRPLASDAYMRTWFHELSKRKGLTR